jgi:hypothetical protein
MATSSILGGSIPPEQLIPGKDTQSLGPGDSSDTGSDTLGAYSEEELASDSDAAGTGERAGVVGDERPDADILPDRAVDESDLLEGSEEDEDLEALAEGGRDGEEDGKERERPRAAAGVENVADIVTDEDADDEDADGESEGPAAGNGDAAVRGGRA